MAAFIKVATTSELAPDQAKKVEVNGKTIALFNLGGSYYAIDNTCTHRGGPLSEGDVEGQVVTCPWHGAKFRIATGELLGSPGRGPVRSYPSRVNGQDVEIEL